MGTSWQYKVYYCAILGMRGNIKYRGTIGNSGQGSTIKGNIEHGGIVGALLSTWGTIRSSNGPEGTQLGKGTARGTLIGTIAV